MAAFGLSRLRRRAKLVVAVGIACVIGILGLYAARRLLSYEPRIDVQPRADFRLGYNLDFPGDWTNLPPFVDHFKNARGMLGVCSEQDPDCHATSHLSLDAEGWVKSLRYRDDPSRSYDRVEIVLSTSQERGDIGKAFAITWKGQGELELFGATARRDPLSRRLEFTLPAGDLILRLTSIDPDGLGDHLREIRVFRLDQERELSSGELFNPEMLEFLAPFTSLRFMDWMQSNEPGRCSGGENPGAACYAVSNESCDGGRCVMAGKWSERPTLDQAILFSSGQFLDVDNPGLGTKVGGYPIEVMVDLANALAASPHFNLPAHFEPEYVERFAKLVLERLDGELPLSVEYSNEVWNWDFPQAKYAEARGKALWPERGTAWVEYMAVRTHEMCEILSREFSARRDRLRCLISPQTGWRELAYDVLDCPGWSEDHPERRSCVEYVDAINVTGYFAGCLPAHPGTILRWLEQGEEAALDRAFQQLEHGGLIEECSGEEEDNLDFTIDTYDHFMQLAARRGLQLEVYEGGTHFEYEQDARVKAFLVRMTRDRRMQALYQRNFEAFRSIGGSVFNVWGWVAKNDAWANADTATDRDHPKYRAIVEFSQGLKAQGLGSGASILSPK